MDADNLASLIGVFVGAFAVIIFAANKGCRKNKSANPAPPGVNSGNEGGGGQDGHQGKAN